MRPSYTHWSVLVGQSHDIATRTWFTDLLVSTAPGVFDYYSTALFWSRNEIDGLNHFSATVSNKQTNKKRYINFFFLTCDFKQQQQQKFLDSELRRCDVHIIREII